MSDENTLVQSTATAETSVPTSSTPASAVESNASNWLDNLSPDIKNDPTLQNFKGKDVSEVVKSYISAQRMLGTSIRIPGPDASIEAKTEFLKKLESVPGVTRLPDPNDAEATKSFLSKIGRPETADGYRLSIPDGTQVDPNLVNEFKKQAHEMGLSNKQADALVQWNIQLDNQRRQVFEAQTSKAIEHMKQEWGNEYENRHAAVKAMVGHFGSKYPEAAQELVYGPAGNNPIVLNALAELAKVYKENGVINGDHVAGGLTPEEARLRIAEINSNINHPANPLFAGKITEKDREAAISEYTKLFKAATSTK